MPRLSHAALAAKARNALLTPPVFRFSCARTSVLCCRSQSLLCATWRRNTENTEKVYARLPKRLTLDNIHACALIPNGDVGKSGEIRCSGIRIGKTSVSARKRRASAIGTISSLPRLSRSRHTGALTPSHRCCLATFLRNSSNCTSATP